MTDYVAFFCNFGVEYNFDVMRTFRFLLLSACCGWSVVTFAQRYELEEVKAGRYEVTNRLDARPDSGAGGGSLPSCRGQYDVAGVGRE